MDMNIESVFAEYFDPMAIRPSATKLYRYNSGHGRYYFTRDDNGTPKFYQSVTTIIHQFAPTPYALMNWKVEQQDNAKVIMETKAAYGTILHIIFKDLLIGESVDLSESYLNTYILEYLHKNNIQVDTDGWIDNFRQDILGIIKWIQDYEIKPIAIEVGLTHTDGFAGCVDLIAYSKVGIIIVDLKSNRNTFYTDNIVQLEAYQELVNENYPDLTIDGVYNLGMKDYRLPIGKTVTPYRFENQTDKPEREYWRHYLMMSQLKNTNTNPDKYYLIEGIAQKDSDISTLIKAIDPIEQLQSDELSLESEVI